MWQSPEERSELPAEDPSGVLESAEARLEAAESADDEARLKTLEDIHGALEAELERPEFAPQQ